MCGAFDTATAGGGEGGTLAQEEGRAPGVQEYEVKCFQVIEDVRFNDEVPMSRIRWAERVAAWRTSAKRRSLNTWAR